MASMLGFNCPACGPRKRASLRVLARDGFRAFVGTDLRSSELASANAATPARRRGVCDYWHSLQIGALGSY